MIESRFRVYHSHYPVLNNDHDCFHRFERNSNDLARHLVPYCIRYNTSNNSIENCFGISYTYGELRLANITSSQLFQWFAPIDMIDDYAAYLLSDMENTNAQERFCKCLDSYSFGKFCQYRFDLESDESSFDEIVHQSLLSHRFDGVSIDLINEENFTTCYELFDCVTLFGFCLDWREINDGVKHCIDGKDEEDFVHMELTECDLNTEYRCRNGLCIPRSFLFDRTYDCLDWFDEQYVIIDDGNEERLDCWPKMATAECEEHRLGLNFFSCGDGERLPIISHAQKNCSNLRDILLIKTLFRPYFNQTFSNICYMTMFYELNLYCLFSRCSNVHTSDQFLPSSRERDLICRELYFFPPGPFVFPYVRLLYKYYDSVPSCMEPDFLCWNQSFCNIYHDETLFDFEGFNCLPIEYFGSMLNFCTHSIHRSMTNLILIVQTIFSHCSEKETYPTLYRCLNHLYISSHQLMDAKFSDCSPWQPDYGDEKADNHTKMVCHSSDRFSCNDDQCIPRMAIQDRAIDCKNSRYIDEVFGIGCVDEFACQCLREINLKNAIRLINYQELCNNYPIFGDSNIFGGSNDTDETDCEMWPCRDRYMQCDGIWQRRNGCDEVNCPSLQKNICADSEHPCAFFNSTNIGCLPVAKAGDGQFDCLFGSDERRTILPPSMTSNSKYPTVHKIQYGLVYWNHFDQSIFPAKVCDGVKDCPLNDDELFFGWRNQSSCVDDYTQFACKNGGCISKSSKWCNGIIDCYPEGADEWLCDILVPHTITRPGFRLPSYLPLSSNGLIERKIQISRKSRNPIDCHRGIVIEDKIKDSYTCLCPPSYYGSSCQFQSERLTISYRAERPFNSDERVIYRFVFYLLVENNQVLTYETMICAIFNEQFLLKQLVYLNYPRSGKSQFMFSKKFVRIDSYYLTNSSVQVSSLSWFYSVQFSNFLPVTRLAALLYLEEELQNRTKYCQDFGKCHHGTCQLYINSGAPFCRCDEGWSGLMCDVKISSDLCAKRNCSGQFSRCVTYNNHAFCMCALGRMGQKCQLPFDACSSIKCQNNGTCHSLDERTVKQVCQCSPPYFGNLCQYSTAQLKLYIDRNISYAPLLIVHFLHSLERLPGVLVHRKIFFFRNIHPNTELVMNDTQQVYLPPLIFAQVFFDSNRSEGSYYLLSISNINRSQITTEIKESHRCPHVNEYLNSTLINANWLKRVKFYHLVMKNVKCFYDEIYLCLVDKHQIPDCLTFNHNAINCIERNYCENGGQCFQRKQLGQLEYACICPQCTAGSFCQIQMNQFSLTLDSMLGQTILIDTSLYSQPIVIKILLVLISVMFIIGVISNLCSFVTFRPATSRKTGCGTYLLILSIANQITLCVFITCVIFLLYSQVVVINNRKLLEITCYLLDFVLQMRISFCDWLPVCVACERTTTVLQGIKFSTRFSKSLVRFVVPILAIITILTSIHQAFNHILVADPRSNDRLWCVIKHRQEWLRTYGVLISCLNNFVPFIINFILGIILLIRLSLIRHRAQNSNQVTYQSVLFAQIKIQKEILIAPVSMIIAKLPLLIVSFAIKCMTEQWHLYLSIIAYTLSLLPLTSTFIIFIWPSTIYMQIFQTCIEGFKRNPNRQRRI